jgi:hypothetical protein
MAEPSQAQNRFHSSNESFVSASRPITLRKSVGDAIFPVEDALSTSGQGDRVGRSNVEKETHIQYLEEVAGAVQTLC